jgi:bifunctional DNase/RNase
MLETRRHTMAQVEMVIDSVRRSANSDEWVVLLKAKLGERYLPIYVGSSQANAIARALKDEPFSESLGDSCGLPHIATILPMAEAASVTITRFENDIFHARLSIEYRGKNCEVECSAAKALALGVRAGAQLFADESILNRAGVIATA